MPSLPIRATELHVDISGDGPETVVFVHGLMLASESWHAQVAALSPHYRVITFDLRGQGRSAKPRDGLDLDGLADDTAALIARLCDRPCHLVGFSMGSFVALRVAAAHPDLLASLTLVGPSAEAEDPDLLPRYHRLIALVRLFGPRFFARPMLRILFGDTFLNDPAQAPVVARWTDYLRRLPRSLARAARASAHRSAITHLLPGITTPTLVISGTEDRPISPTRAMAVAAAIPGARFLAVPDTGHAVMIERPALFNAALLGFLAAPGG